MRKLIKSKYVKLRFKAFRLALRFFSNSEYIAKTKLGRKFLMWYSMRSIEMLTDTLKYKFERGDKK